MPIKNVFITLVLFFREPYKIFMNLASYGFPNCL